MNAKTVAAWLVPVAFLILLGFYMLGLKIEAAMGRIQTLESNLSRTSKKLDFVYNRIGADEASQKIGALLRLETRIEAMEREWQALPAGVVFQVVDPTAFAAKAAPPPATPPPAAPAVAVVAEVSPPAAAKARMTDQMARSWLPMGESATDGASSSYERRKFSELARNLTGEAGEAGGLFLLDPPTKPRLFVRTRTYVPPGEESLRPR